MNWLNYHHLYYFHRIVECGSISKAAVELRLGQPTISSQLKELEGRLGILFERKSKSLILTERGKIVYKYAKEIFSRGDELLGVLERGELAPQRELILGAQEGVPKTIISETILRLHKKTKTKVRVIEGDAPLLLNLMLDGKVDMVVFDHELTHTSGTVTFLSVGNERVSFWGTKEYEHLAKGYPHSLNNQPVVLSTTGHPLRQSVENFFQEHNLHLNVVVEAPDTALIKELGRAGIGIVALGDRTVKAWTKEGTLKKIGNVPYTQKYLLGLPKRLLKDPIAEVILKEFRIV